MELYFAWRLVSKSKLPVEDPVTTRWISSQHVLADAHTKTLSVDLAVFRSLVAGISRDFGFSLVRGFVALPHASIYRRMSAIQLGWPNTLSDGVLVHLTRHFAQKPLRRTIDMARKVDLCDARLVEWYRDGSLRSEVVD